MSTATASDPKVHTEVVTIALALIDRDPGQPRFAENVDTDLAPSFKEHGWFPDEPLKVRPHPEKPDRFMLVNGERRYAGAKAAGLHDALCVFSLDEEGVREADRLIVQIVSNSGKPLTPIEEAVAFKRIIDDRRADRYALPENGKPPKLIEAGDKKYGPVALARELGLPKSTVTDRLAATEIPAFWLPFIVKGPLQSSHVPILHKWRKLPEKFQRRGLERMQEDHRWKGGGWDGRRGRKGANDRIHVGDFDHMLDEHFKSYVRPVSEVSGYKGPTERMANPRNYSHADATMAMDPSIWQPIARKKSAERKKRNAQGGGGSSQQSTWQKQEAERQARYRREEEARQRARKQVAAARPKLLAAFESAVAAATFTTLRDLVVAESLPHNTPKANAVLARKANTAEAVLRALAMAAIASSLNSHYDAAFQLPKLAKRWKVDVAKLMKAAETAEKPDPATTDPGEAGDGRTVVGAGVEDEGDDDA